MKLFYHLVKAKNLSYILIVAVITVGQAGLNGWKKQNLHAQCQRKVVHLITLHVKFFFGRLKNEMFYGYSWTGVTIDQFIEELDKYIRWYAEKRIKLSLGGMSPLDYRRSLGLAV
jgi:hypothetical protein